MVEFFRETIIDCFCSNPPCAGADANVSLSEAQWSMRLRVQAGTRAAAGGAGAGGMD